MALAREWPSLLMILLLLLLLLLRWLLLLLLLLLVLLLVLLGRATRVARDPFNRLHDGRGPCGCSFYGRQSKG